MSSCRSCGAPVWWVSTGAKRMPLDPMPDPEGNVVVDTVGHATVHGSTAAAIAAGATGEQLRRSHFATCPQAGSWRSRNPR